LNLIVILKKKIVPNKPRFYHYDCYYFGRILLKKFDFITEKAGKTISKFLMHTTFPGLMIIIMAKVKYVEFRVRARLLEHNTVSLFDSLFVSERFHKEGLIHLSKRKMER
jgi:hypothetical protein